MDAHVNSSSMSLIIADSIIELLMANLGTVLDEDRALRNHTVNADSATDAFALKAAFKGLLAPDRSRGGLDSDDPLEVTFRKKGNEENDYLPRGESFDNRFCAEEPTRARHDEFQTTKLQDVKRRFITPPPLEVGSQRSLSKRGLKRSNSRRKAGRELPTRRTLSQFKIAPSQVGVADVESGRNILIDVPKHASTQDVDN